MYKYMSTKTGEIVPNLKEAIRSAWIDLKDFHIINIVWKYNKKGW